MINELFHTFLKSWPEEKIEIKDLLKKAKAANLTNSITDKKKKASVAIYDYSSAKVISEKIPAILHKDAAISSIKYLIDGSIGDGQPAEVPWIGIFDKEITESAQKGYYIVYLFDSTMRGFYLSLNQGWTQYEKTYGKKEARIRIKHNAYLAQNLLKSLQEFNLDPIHLSTKRPLGAGYELGNICSKFYDAHSLPSDQEILDDLRNLIGVYRELKGAIGKSILNINGIDPEEKFQEAIQSAISKIIPSGAIPKSKQRSKILSSPWERDPEMAHIALETAGFKCENDHSHRTFLSHKTERQFVEAHHLVPMEFQDEFEVSIDVPENIICLCPNCHRAFHYSDMESRKMLVLKFLELRKEALFERKIRMGIDEILKYYRI
jgi:5-methylcytosine-specific restriction protein A